MCSVVMFGVAPRIAIDQCHQKRVLIRCDAEGRLTLEHAQRPTVPLCCKSPLLETLQSRRCCDQFKTIGVATVPAPMVRITPRLQNLQVRTSRDEVITPGAWLEVLDARQHQALRHKSGLKLPRCLIADTPVESLQVTHLREHIRKQLRNPRRWQRGLHIM